MKKLIGSIIIFSFCSIIQAESWKAYSLQIDGGKTPSSLGVFYQGQLYSPTKAITVMNEKIDRSSPESLLKSWLWAANHADGAVYNELFSTNQLIEPFANDPTIKITQLSLSRIIQYGDIYICKFDISFLNTNSAMPFTNAAMLFPMQKKGNEYFATEELLSDKAYRFIKFYYDVSPLYGIPHEQEFKDISFKDNCFLYMTNYPFCNTNILPPIIFRIQGKYFETNAIIDKWPTKADQDLSTPAGTLASAVAALNSADIERYSSLLHPDEKNDLVRYGLNTIVGHTWDSVMRDQFKLEASLKRPSAIRLEKEIVYTDGMVALVYENTNNQNGDQQDVLYFRKSGTNWFISHTMEEKGVQLMDYLGFSTSMHTKVFPHFDLLSVDKK